MPVGWTFTISPQYTAHLSGDWDWYARLDWKHRGRYYPNATNIDWIGARNIIDVHLGVKNETFTLEAFALNLNKDYTFQNGEYGADSTCCALTAPNINEVRLLLPAKRQFGIRGTYSFKTCGVSRQTGTAWEHPLPGGFLLDPMRCGDEGLSTL